MEERLNIIEAEIEKLRTRVHKHDSDLSAENVRLVLLDKNIELLTDFLKKFDKSLNGDGVDHPGLLVRIDRLEMAEKDRKDEDKARKMWRMSVLAGIIAAVAMAGGSFLIVLLRLTGK